MQASHRKSVIRTLCERVTHRKKRRKVPVELKGFQAVVVEGSKNAEDPELLSEKGYSSQ